MLNKFSIPIIILVFSLFIGIQKEAGFFRKPAQVSESIINEKVDLDRAELMKVARNIYAVSELAGKKYKIADALMLTLYVTRYMAEIGDYKLAHKDLMILVEGFEKLMGGDKLDPQIYQVLKQIRRVVFKKRNGKLTAKFFAFRRDEGIIIPIQESVGENEIDEVIIENGGLLEFSEVIKRKDKRRITNFIKSKGKVLGSEKLGDDLYQVNPNIVNQIDSYLNKRRVQIPPMDIKMSKMLVKVRTSTILGNINFRFYRAIVLPGIKKGASAIPNLVLGANGKKGAGVFLDFDLKVSIDQ